FIRDATMAGGGFWAISKGLDNLVSNVEAAPSFEMVVAKGSSPMALVEAAIKELGGMKSFISKGDIVVIKPNIGWDRTPEQAANTNPDVVAGLIKLCFDAGAKKVKVFDRTVNDPRRCYVQSGIEQVAKKYGADLHYVDEKRFKEVNIKDGQVLKSWPLYVDILEADKVINVPIAKHHSLSKLTMAMKNWMGVMGGSRRHIHQKLDESLADLSLAIKPTLTVLDAIRILTANGPQGGSLADVKKMDTIVVSRDQVAVDSFGATLFGMKGSDLGYVKIADQYGLGKMDLTKGNIKRINV
ncbi:MAG: DUF362 domain-containing protein, partial [Thermodesulfovibrionales bacterium]|nr:DUF362 domain-containing protein [Thermodesulfovibrionales bacterium]